MARELERLRDAVASARTPRDLARVLDRIADWQEAGYPDYGEGDPVWERRIGEEGRVCGLLRAQKASVTPAGSSAAKTPPPPGDRLRPAVLAAIKADPVGAAERVVGVRWRKQPGTPHCGLQDEAGASRALAWDDGGWWVRATSPDKVRYAESRTMDAGIRAASTALLRALLEGDATLPPECPGLEVLMEPSAVESPKGPLPEPPSDDTIPAGWLRDGPWERGGARDAGIGGALSGPVYSSGTGWRCCVRRVTRLPEGFRWESEDGEVYIDLCDSDGTLWASVLGGVAAVWHGGDARRYQRHPGPLLSLAAAKEWCVATLFGGAR